LHKLVVAWLEREARRRPWIKPLHLQRRGGPRSSRSSYSATSASLGTTVGEQCGPTSFSCAPRFSQVHPPNAPARRSLSSPSPAPRVGNEASCSDAFCLAPIGDDTFYLLSYALCTQGKHGFCLSKLQHLVELSLKAGRCKGSRPAGQLYHTY
jgi:hypothetical protein